MKALSILMLLMPCLCLAQINRLERETRTRRHAVEITPGVFIHYLEHVVLWELKHRSFSAVHTMENEKAKFYQKNTSYLLIPWKGQRVSWVGVGVPISIRAHDGILFMIVFDRASDFGKIRFRYFMQNHTVLSEIAAADYPKGVATQNLWLRKENGVRDGKPINQIEIARDLNPDDIDLQDSLTAKVWYQLGKGKEYYEMDNRIDAAFLRTFMEKHNVERLKQVVK